MQTKSTEISDDVQAIYRELAPTLENSHALANDAYYRSRLITSQAGRNRLLTAAEPILILLGRLGSSRLFAQANTLETHLEHEMKAFETRLVAAQYPSEAIRLARYLLSVSLDDVISHSQWGQEGHWLGGKCLKTTTFVPHDDRFFDIVQQMLADPSHHYEFLEIIYVVLNLGYQGKYRDQKDGLLAIDRLMDDVYPVIQRYQEDTKKAFPALENKRLTVVKKRRKPLFSTRVLLSVGIFVLVSVQVMFHYVLTLSAQPATEQLKSIQQQLEEMG